MKRQIGLVVALAIFLCGGCNKVTYQGLSFRTNGGMNVKLADAGNRRGMPWNSYCQPFDRLTFPEGQEVGTVVGEITQGREWESSISVAISVEGVPASGEAATKQQYADHGRFVIIDTNQAQLISAMNSEANKVTREFLFKNYGTKARVVNEVAVAYAYKTNATDSGRLGLNAKYKVVNGKIVLEGSTHTTTELSDGIIYAYRFARIDWVKDANGNPTPVVNSLPDDN